MAMLRPMHGGDLAEITAIEHRAYEYPWTNQIFRDCLQAGYHAFTLALPETIVGYFLLSIAAGEAHVLNLCVDPAQQGKGHGRRLIRQAVDIARAQRADRIFLEVRPSNAVAIGLYHTIGFNEIGRRPKYYPTQNGREDALIMAMEILPEITR